MLPLRVRETVVHGDEDLPILKVAGLDIAPGAKIGIRGPSGAGKSTLLFLLAGLVRPKVGRVFWGHTDLTRLPDYRRDAFRRKHFGIIFQEALLFEELNAVANACVEAQFAPADARRNIERNAARLLERLGIQTGNRPVDTHSGGERQRIAVARALAGNPAVILADEPTASLDRASADKLISDLLAIAEQGGKTFIMVSHDQGALTAMDRIIDVLDGSVRPCRPESATA